MKKKQVKTQRTRRSSLMAETSKSRRNTRANKITATGNPKNSFPLRSIRLQNRENGITLGKSIEIKSVRSVRPKKEINPITAVSVIEMKKKKKMSDSSDKFLCQICAEMKKMDEAFEIKGCNHSFCSDCMVRYVASKIQENVISIGCPEMNCQGVLEPELCRSILPLEVYDRWGKALCESLVPGAQKFYCPFKDCSALLVDDGDGGILESECPHCNRLFCAQCKVPWHAEIQCADFQKLNVDEREREDILLMKTAKKNKWQRCPSCSFYVERSFGCLLMKCRCGNSFCYHCGSPMKDHYCEVCKR